MKHFTIENAKTRLFESKEHYLNFRQAWKSFHNSDKLVWREDEEVYVYDQNKYVTMRNVKHTALGAEHYMLYNLLRGYNSERGFREDSDHGWTACEYAVWEIWRVAVRLKDVNSKSSSSRRYSREAISKLLLPFGDTISHQMLYEVGKAISEQFYGHDSSTHFNFEVEEWKDFTKEDEAKSKMSIAERIQSWRAA